MKIEGINGILQILRRRVGTSSQRTDGSQQTDRKEEADLPVVDGRASTADLEAGIRSRIRELNPDDEDYQEQATGIFLESVLLWEFGEDMSRDQEFSEIMTRIKDSFASNDELRQQMNRLVRQLSE
jgi:hypothetical protein